MMLFPFWWIPLIMPFISKVALGSKPAVGSSRTYKSGSPVIAILQNGQLIYDNEIESSYIFKIANISRQVLEMLASDFSLSVDKLGTTLTAQITKEQVPLLISALTSHDISIFEVTACNVKRIVQEQLHLEEVRK